MTTLNTNRRHLPAHISQRQITASGYLDTLSRALQRLHQLNRGLSLHQLIILVTVSQRPGATTKELRRETGLSAASVSRNTNALSSLTRKGQLGLGLIDMRQDPDEPRRYNFHLTKRGLDVALDIVDVLEGRSAG